MSPIVVAVKWVLTALAFLAVAACDPYYGQEPYGPQPYPYPDPAPYPQDPYPPAPGGYPGQAPYQPLPPECLITSSSRVDRLGESHAGTGRGAAHAGRHRQGRDSDRRVPGRVRPAHAESGESYPVQAFVDLQVANSDGSAGIPGADHSRSPLGVAAREPVGSVIVRCGDKTLAEIRASKPPIKAATAGPTNRRAARMFNLVSLIIGFVALLCAVVAFLPLLGWVNWLIIPLAIIGAGVGVLAQGNGGPQSQPVRDCRRSHPADARRWHPVKSRRTDRRLYREGGALRAADPDARSRPRSRSRPRRRGNAQMGRAGVRSRRQDPADHGCVQGACGTELLARAGTSRRGCECRRNGSVRQAHLDRRPAGRR